MNRRERLRYDESNVRKVFYVKREKGRGKGMGGERKKKKRTEFKVNTNWHY